MIVAITDGRANISLKRSNDPEAAATTDVPRPSATELKVKFAHDLLIIATMNVPTRGLTEVLCQTSLSDYNGPPINIISNRK